MATVVNLKELERKVIRSYFHDGLWDIYGAFILLGIGLTMVIGWDYLILAFAIVAVVLLLFRKRIIVPRLGQVKFSSERQAKTKRSVLIAMITLTFTMLLGVCFFVLFSTNSVPEWLDIWMGNYFLAAFGGIQALLVVIAAYIVGVRRYYVYAALIFISYVLAGIMRPSDMEGIPIVIAGSIILISGAVILTRFLRKYPLQSQEINNASR
jgi:MFS family permease